MKQKFTEFGKFRESDRPLKHGKGLIQRFSLLPMSSGTEVEYWFLT